MVLVYEQSRSIPYVHGVIFQFTSLKYGLGYKIKWRHGASWRLKSFPQIETGLFCFQKFVHDKPQKCRHNGLLRWESFGRRWFPSQRASNVEGVSTPWRLMITYKWHRYIHLIRQLVCMRKPDNALFCLVGLDQHGTYIQTIRIVIYVINYYSTRKFAMKNEWWLFTLIFHNVHEQGTSRSSSIFH